MDVDQWPEAFINLVPARSTKDKALLYTTHTEARVESTVYTYIEPKPASAHWALKPSKQDSEFHFPIHSLILLPPTNTRPSALSLNNLYRTYTLNNLNL